MEDPQEAIERIPEAVIIDEQKDLSIFEPTIPPNVVPELDTVEQAAIEEVLQDPHKLKEYLEERGHKGLGNLSIYFQENPRHVREIVGVNAEIWLQMVSKLEIGLNRRLRERRQATVGILSFLLATLMVTGIVIGLWHNEDQIYREASAISIEQFLKDAEANGCVIQVEISRSSNGDLVRDRLSCGTEDVPTPFYTRGGENTLVAPVSREYLAKLGKREKIMVRAMLDKQMGENQPNAQ